jgi:hypothetical protein
MKLIESVSIWNNGQANEGSILNAYAVNVSLSSSATFWWGLYAKNEDDTQGLCLAHGNILMEGDDYKSWQEDTIVWEFIASKLNLTITGDYVAPVIETPVVEETIVNEEISE